MSRRLTVNADRKRRAKAAIEFCHIMARDKQGRAVKVRVPGHLGKMHETILRWEEHTVSAECRIDTGLGGYVSCPGQGFVCYHAMASVIYACQDRGYKVSIGALDGLKKLKNLGGIIIALQSWVTGKGVQGETVWAMIRPKTPEAVHHLDGERDQQPIVSQYQRE
jgi:hypothetical protein